jgi:4-diphosphocytidyl-2-C-methyl-D-erythritol kinase
VLCPAKVNLYLRVVGRRPDGYHELVTVMQPLTLADVLTVILAGQDISLECDHPELPPGEENLVWRAARQFQAETGQKPGVRLTLRKRIPVAAGLGGGSSDAAGTLWALNELAGKPLEPARLHRLAGRLGADVPFFLRRAPAVGRGTGTQLSAVTLLPYWYLLLNPGVPLSTRWVYENLDLAGLPGPSRAGAVLGRP